MEDESKDFKFFGGFYLTVQEEENHLAVCTYADSREADVAFTPLKWYLRIDFKEEKIKALNMQDMIGFPANFDGSKANSVFPLNDLQALNIASKAGKKILVEDTVYDINAEEVRLSPNNDRVIVEEQTEKGKGYYVAKLYNGKIENKKTLTKELSLRALSNVFWLSNDYFAVG
jgi:hypothetical protein